MSKKWKVIEIPPGVPAPCTHYPFTCPPSKQAIENPMGFGDVKKGEIYKTKIFAIVPDDTIWHPFMMIEINANTPTPFDGYVLASIVSAEQSLLECIADGKSATWPRVIQRGSSFNFKTWLVHRVGPDCSPDRSGDYPHRCYKCGKAAYLGFNLIEHMDSGAFEC